MLEAVILFLAGLVLLIKGGQWIVDGATGIAHRFHLSELLIGATVVSIGTTLPEIMVSSASALGGHSEIAYGNAIGSVICNTALIAALTIAVRPQKISRKTLIMPVGFFFVSAIFYAVISYSGGSFTRISGIVLLIIFIIYITSVIFSMIKEDSQKTLTAQESAFAGNEAFKEEHSYVTGSSLWKEIIMFIAGSIMVAAGANLLVDNGSLIAEALKVPESVIALTIIAVGTSLPELVTAISSLFKGHGTLSLGDVIGANLFNLVLVCGISITLKPFDIPVSSKIFGQNASLVLDIPVMFAVMLLLTVPALIRQKMTRVQGAILLSIYFAYCIIQFMM